jgi:hypothetical protein
MTSSKKEGHRLDLFRRFEQELRTPKEPLPIDPFLPAPETIASSIPAPASVASEQAAQPQGFVQQLRAQDPEPTPREPAAAPRRRKKSPESGSSKSLQDEIAEFMNRDRGALAPDVDSES